MLNYETSSVKYSGLKIETSKKDPGVGFAVTLGNEITAKWNCA
jgi:hypothetical protein